MNPKKSSGWILCPSKSFPGNFYYFNVNSGETAWTLSDTQSKLLKKNGCNIENVTDSTNYPEPATPPVFEKQQTFKPAPTMTKSFNHPVPVFGQAVFPKSLPPAEPSTIYVLMPLQMPAFTPLSAEPDFTKSRDTRDTILVQTCNQPITKRIINYDSPVLKFDKNNKLIKNTSTPKTNSERKIIKDPIFVPNTYEKDLIKDGVPNLKNSKEVGAKSMNSEEKSFCIPNLKNKEVGAKSMNIEEKSFSYEDFKNSLIAKPKETLLMVDKCCSPMTVIDEAGPSKNLDANDLRMILLAKKRKTVDLSDDKIQDEIIPPKKKVTFKLDTEVEMNHEINKDVQQNQGNGTIINKLKKLCPFVTEEWYITTDCETLMDEFNFIDSFVQMDSTCRLLLPRSVIQELSSLCAGDCRGRERVTIARHCLRRITANFTYIVQSTDTGLKYAEDSIINCCLLFKHNNQHVILVTNNQYLLNTAKNTSIHAYTIDQLKNDIDSNEQVTFDIKKIKITVNRDSKMESAFIPIQNQKDKFEEKYNENTSKTEWRSNVSDITDISKDLEHFDPFDRMPKKNIDTNYFKPYNLEHKDENSLFKKPEVSKINDNETLLERDRFENRISNLIPNSSNFKNDISNEMAGNSIFDIDSNYKLPVYNLDEFLRRFCLKNKIIENKLVGRTEEWICTFRQIMEDSLSDFLQNTSETTKIPLNLFDAIQLIKKMNEGNKIIFKVVEKLCILMYNSELLKGKSEKCFTANEVLQIIGCGLFLILVLKDTNPITIQLKDAEESLINLLKLIDQGDEDVKSLQRTSATSRTDNNEYENRCNFVKPRSDVINYLKKHYNEWKNYEEKTNETQIKVLRTYGKNLNLLKINRAKKMIMAVEDETKVKKGTQPKINSTEITTEPKVMIKLQNERVKQKLNFDFDQPIHENTFGENKAGPKVIRNITTIKEYEERIINKNGGTKNLEHSTNSNDSENISSENSRNNQINIDYISDNEKYIINSENYLLDQHLITHNDENNESCTDNNYTDSLIDNHNYTTDQDHIIDNCKDSRNHTTDNIVINKNNYTENCIDNRNYTTDNRIIDNNYTKHNDYYTNPDNNYTLNNSPVNNQNYTKYNDNCTDNNSTNDSGIDSECHYALPIVKSMCIELSGTFKIIKKFIEDAYKLFQLNKIKQNKLLQIGNKAAMLHSSITRIIVYLQGIINNETNGEVKLNSLLSRAGVSVNDLGITSYKQVITKFMETAKVYENSLKIIKLYCNEQ